MTITNYNSIKRAQFPTHPFHMLEVSPWPLVMAFSVYSLLNGFVLYFHGIAYGDVLLTLGLISTLAAFSFWFTDVTTESTYLGDHTKIVQKGITMGVSLFILTEAFFFMSIFWAYLHSSLSPSVEMGGVWPPAGIEAMNPFAIPLLNTALLLSSGATITYAHHALIAGNRGGALLGTTLTIVLAVLFTYCQYIEYVNAPFTIADSVYGTVFFFGTGFHGLHILVGTIFLAVGLWRIYTYSLTDDHHVGYESGILYWHFVDVVWLFLYVMFYWWGS